MHSHALNRGLRVRFQMSPELMSWRSLDTGANEVLSSQNALSFSIVIRKKPGGGALPPPGADVIATFAQSKGLQDSTVGGETGRHPR